MRAIVALSLSVLVAASSGGCLVSSARYKAAVLQNKALEQRIAALEARPQAERAQAEQPAVSMPVTAPGAEASAIVTGGPGSAPGFAPLVGPPTADNSARAWVRRSHGKYVCFAGGPNPFKTVGPKLRLNNAVGANEFVSCRLNGEEMVVVGPDGGSAYAPFVHPGTGETLLPPGDTCILELGAAEVGMLECGAYRNAGTRGEPLFGPEPYMRFPYDKTTKLLASIEFDPHRNVLVKTLKHFHFGRRR